MFKSIFKFCSILVCCLCIFSLNAQPWVENLQNEQDKNNFYSIQSSFNQYWEGKEIEKGKGFKPYKRWEWYWENRVNEDGTFPEAGITERNWQTYLRNNEANNNRMNTANWTSLGPTTTPGGYNGLGRINCVAFHPTNTNIIWVGSPGGGLWKTTNGGTTWSTVTDMLPVLGVSSIVIHPTNPDIMYIATGDGNASDTYSIGVLKSIDGGNTWSTTGLNWTVNQNRVIRRLIMDPDDVNTLMIASSNGIHRTTNAGATWSSVQTGSFFDIQANPNASTNTFYAATGNAIFRSTNNGLNWTSVQTISGSGRIALGVSPANENYVYALCSNASTSGFLGMYRSNTSGSSQSFTLQASTPNLLGWNLNGSDTGGQGWYDLCIAIDPSNAEIVYTGGVNTWKSTNGGTSWAINTMWYSGQGVPAVHADKHCMEWQGNTLWQGNDGGIYRTTNGGSTWQDRSPGLIISQMYKLGVSQSDTKVITGLQDNGTKLRNTAGTWSDHIGGDGMECAIRPNNASVLYASLYYGTFNRSTNSGSNWTNITNSIPGGGGQGAWVTPFVIDPNVQTTIYTAYNSVYKSTNQGTSWTTIGSGLGSGTMRYMNVAPSNSNYIYVGRSGNLYRTTNGGANWSTRTVPGSNTVMLAIHPTNPDILWAVRSNYTAGAKVYKSTNGGSTWTNVSGSLPNLPVNCIVYANGTNEGIYIGMDVGVFYRDNDILNWELFNAGLPNVEVTELEIKYDTQEIFASTYGRGLWKSNLRTNTVACPIPLAFNVEMDVYSAALAWTAPNPAPLNGYQYTYSLTNPPASGTNTTSLNGTINGLNSNTYYNFFVRSQCETGVYSDWSRINFAITHTTCGDVATDARGPITNYANNENTIRYICPESNDDYVKITFTDFGIEPQYDALYIFDGDNFSAPMISSNNPSTLSDFPAGGYYGFSNPGPFSSTHESGCLTLQFRSDESVTESGWIADVECFLRCAPMVSNTNDSGYGSLRNVIECSSPNDTIFFADNILNQVIMLTSGQINIPANLTIIGENKNVIIQAMNTGPIFNISNGISLHLEDIELRAGNGSNNQRAIHNQGNLTLKDMRIRDEMGNNGTGQTILNLGSINLMGENEIKLE